MSNLIKSKKNGSLANTNSQQQDTFPAWSSWIDDMFNNDLPSLFKSNFNTGISLPKVNILELDDSFKVELAAPGLKKDDFTIEIDNTVLSIAAEIENKEETETDEYTRREFGYSSFKRSFNLPESVDDSKIKATYKEGILCITIPKKEEAKRKPTRNIKIS